MANTRKPLQKQIQIQIHVQIQILGRRDAKIRGRGERARGEHRERNASPAKRDFWRGAATWQECQVELNAISQRGFTESQPQTGINPGSHDAHEENGHQLKYYIKIQVLKCEKHELKSSRYLICMHMYRLQTEWHASMGRSVDTFSCLLPMGTFPHPEVYAPPQGKSLVKVPPHQHESTKP